MHLLVAALHRAVALAEENALPCAVGEDLDLDVARVLEELLHVDRRVAERRAASALRHRHDAARIAASRATRMPRPPPPPAALMITG